MYIKIQRKQLTRLGRNPWISHAATVDLNGTVSNACVRTLLKRFHEKESPSNKITLLEYYILLKATSVNGISFKTSNGIK